MLVKSKKELSLKVPSDMHDETVDEFFAQLDSIIGECPQSLSLDCEQLKNAYSLHVATLWQAFSQCQEASIDVKLTSVTYNLKQTLRLLDLHDLMLGMQIQTEPEIAKDKSIRKALSTEVLQMEFPANVDSIKESLETFRAYLKSMGTDNLITFELATIFYEVATNIRLHSGLNENQMIKFSSSSSDWTVILCFTDSGKEFNPLEKETPYDPKDAIKQGRRRGLGLILIKRIASSMQYIRGNNNMNTFTIIKNIYNRGE